ncbi:MAG: HEAT repeat domain-containing protein [Prochloron sp. SP5CPC1]|nr:HEAT repeat domain-containing protein [Candidatus Paraprochloron terpiosi SP5CPC1]
MNTTLSSIQKLVNSSDFGDRIRGINELRHLEPEIAFKMLEPLVQDKNTRVRYAAVSHFDTIGTANLSKSLELLRERLLNDPEPDVQAAAADSLGALKLTEAFDDLQQVYNETSEWLVKFSIIAVLGEFGDPRGFDILVDALTSDNSLFQTAAISALRELGDKRALPHLLVFADNEDWQLRYRLVQALGKLGDHSATAILEKLAEDEVETVAQLAKNTKLS